jgi:hypothetical protein
MPALLPSANASCLAIIKIEGEGSLPEFCTLFCKTLREFAMPPGNILLFSTMTHLHHVGLEKYIVECINVVRRYKSMFKDKCIILHNAHRAFCRSVAFLMQVVFALSLISLSGWSPRLVNVCASTIKLHH